MQLKNGIPLLLSLLIGTPIVVLLRACSFYLAYTWFFIPLGLPALNMWWVYAITIFISFITMDIRLTRRPYESDWGPVLDALAVNAVFIFIMWVLTFLAF